MEPIVTCRLKNTWPSNSITDFVWQVVSVELHSVLTCVLYQVPSGGLCCLYRRHRCYRRGDPRESGRPTWGPPHTRGGVCIPANSGLGGGQQVPSIHSSRPEPRLSYTRSVHHLSATNQPPLNRTCQSHLSITPVNHTCQSRMAIAPLNHTCQSHMPIIPVNLTCQTHH